MKAIFQIALAALLFQIGFTAIAAAETVPACFYLDKEKIHDEVMPLFLTQVEGFSKPDSLRLEKSGLFQGNKRLCRWSFNGGSGTKEQFSLDGGFAAPILDDACEAPFSHKYTGVGFGDWYLTLCGMVSHHNLYVEYGGKKYTVPVEALKQWTRFTPEKFPVQGDKGH